MNSELEYTLVEPRYGIAETARLVGMSAARVRRWLRGYAYEWTVDGKRKRGRQKPVVQRLDSSESGASFLDLIELLFVKGFVDKGISLQKIRGAVDDARVILEIEYPFANRKFFSDGREIYLQLKEGEPEHILQLFSGGQWVIPKVIRSMSEQITFDEETDLPLKFWPLGQRHSVVIDPFVAFGAPSLSTAHVKTSNIYDQYLGEDRNVRAVAEWYGVSPADVRAAIRFEEHLLAA